MKYFHTILFFLFLSIFPSVVNAGGWIKKIGVSTSSIVDPVFTELENDSTFAISGTTSSKLFVGKFHKGQFTMTGRTFDSTGVYEQPRVIIPSRFNQGYWVFAYGGGPQNLIYKTDSTGRVLFCKRYSVSGNLGYNLRLHELPNGDILASSEHAILRIDSSGTLRWSKTLPGFNLLYKEIIVLSNSRFLMAGEIGNAIAWNSASDFFLQCWDTSGTVLWTKTYGNLTNDEVSTAILAPNGRIYIGGNHILDGGSRGESLLACFDTSGNLQWHKVYKTGQGVEGLMAVSGNKVAMLTGWRGGGPGDSTNRYSILDAQGNLLQSQEIAGAGSFIETADSAVCFTVRKELSGSYLVRLDGLHFPECLNPKPVWFESFTEDWTTGTYTGITFSTASLSAGNGTYATQALNLLAFCQPSCAVSAQFAASTTTPCINTNTPFSNTSIGALQYAWRVNGDSVSAATNFQYVFTTAGTKRVTLVAKNGSCIDSMSIAIEVKSTPVSTYQLSRSDRQILCRADSFTNASYAWNFGDGTSYFGPDTVEHAFVRSGQYTVCLTTMNSCGSSTSCQPVSAGPDASNSFQRILTSPSYLKTIRPSCILQTPDGGFYCTGRSNIGYSFDTPNITRLAADGSLINGWEVDAVSQGGPATYTIDRSWLSRNGTLYYAGHYPGSRAFYGRMDPSGYMWNQRFVCSASVPQTGGIFELDNQNIIFAGVRYSSGLIMMFDRWGRELWEKVYTDIFSIVGIEQTPDSCFIVLGRPSSAEIALFKINNTGQVLWSHSYTDTGLNSSSIKQLLKTRDGNYILAGENGGRGIMLKVDTAGTILWSRAYQNDLMYQIAESLDGSLYFLGHIAPTLENTIVGHTDSLGNLLNGWWSPSVSLTALTATSDTAIAIAGNINYTATFDSRFEIIKFNKNGMTPCGLDTFTINQSLISFTQTTFLTAGLTPVPPIAPDAHWTVSGGMSLPDTLPCYSPSVSFVADFSIIDTVCAGIPVHAVNQSSGTIATYLWHLTGASPDTSSSPTPVITWNTAGNYMVSLIASDSSGNQSIHSQMVTVLDTCLVSATHEITGQFQVYPNPVQNQLFIDDWELLKDKSICLRDLAGRIVFYSKTVTSPVDVSTLAPGCYILELTGRNDLRVTMKIMKQ